MSSLRLTTSRLVTPIARRTMAAGSTVNAGVFAWTRPHRTLNTVSTPTSAMSDTSTTKMWSETMSFASPESDFNMALEHCRRVHESSEPPLPRTWATALHETDAAVVITTATPPHRVVHVNAAWERLCGYSRDEAWDRPIGPLLQQDTPKSHTHQAAHHLIQQLRVDHYREPHDAYLENFTKDGRAFLNHVRVGPLYLETTTDEQQRQHPDHPDFLVGILKEVRREEVPLRMVV